MDVLLEVACFNPESVLIAAQAGAHRIEFCADYASGGVTPSLQDFLFVKEKVTVPIFVMIRPRPGNFVYSSEELHILKSQLSNFKSAGAHGFVFGILTKENEIDVPKNKELIQLANPLPCTLHRAFDETIDWVTTLQQAIECGFKRILTSGGKGSANHNLVAVKRIVQEAGKSISIIAGGGVRSTNAKEIIKETGCQEIHSSALINHTNLADATEIKSLINAI